jgi:hypothetical protein
MLWSLQAANVIVIVCCTNISFAIQIFSSPVPEMLLDLNCPGFPQLFRLELVTAAVWIVSFSLSVLNILRQTIQQ